MSSIIKKIAFLVVAMIGLQSCNVKSSKPENCEVKEITVSKIYEGGVKDIVFAAPNGDFYYINRGLERGYTLEGMRSKVLNKKVTLHLPQMFYGTSKHIKQLATYDELIFTEFSSEGIPSEN